MMTAHQYFQHKHGADTDYLSKDAIIRFAEDFADYKFDLFRKAKEGFQTEILLEKKKGKKEG